MNSLGSMKIHHINCGTMCPASAWLTTGDGGLLQRARFVCHCLLVETRDGLVLVDTGLGTADVAAPVKRLGRGFVRRTRPALDPRETALAHVERLGFRREDLRHIVPTHLDLDHAGGIADFPEAKVHVFRDEYEAGTAPDAAKGEYGYRTVQWAHGPRWVPYEVDGERWFGFGAVRAIPGLDAEVLIVPLVGHSRGHCGVAVRTTDGWLLHAGDAYFSRHEVDLHAPREPLGSGLFQRLRSIDNVARRYNVARLRTLRRAHPEVKVFSAHDAVEYEALRESPLAHAGVTDHARHPDEASEPAPVSQAS
jgi:glyoxylase-like metal-dependent hydrolase (beta-lactamase superfamily II)